VFSHCVTDCRPGEHYRHVLEFRLVALPSGIAAHQDLLRLMIHDQDNRVVRQSTFRVVHDHDTSPSRAPFDIRTKRGRGVVYTLRALPDRQSYQLKVEGIAYDRSGLVVLYHTTFIIHISVASYPY